MATGNEKAQLYIFDNIAMLDEAFLRRSLPYLSAERREKALRYRSSADSALSAAVYLLLRRALKDTCGIDEPVEFCYGERGKPFLRDYPGVFFSLSHCGQAVACAVADIEIGVDVQGIAPVSDKLAERVLTPEELAAFRSADEPYRLFCELWTIKEARLKLTGQGISVKLSELAARDVKPKRVFTDGGGYICGVVGAAGNLSRFIPREPRELLEGLA